MPTEMKRIIITNNSNGAMILKNLSDRKKELELKMEERMKIIRKHGWDAYWKDRIENHGAKYVEGSK